MKTYALLLGFITIAQSVFIDAASISDVIDKPGIYKYRATVISQPTDPNDAIITIASSNVVFDMDGYLLTQHPLVTTTGLTGILIKENLTNIAIRNGRIDNVTGCGIKVSDGCKKIKVADMVISNCDSGGILLDGQESGTGVDSFLMQSSILLSCTGFNGSPAFGFKAAHSSAIGAYDCFFNDNDAVTTSSGYGVWLDSCACAQFIRCCSTDNGGDWLGVGFAASKSINLCFQNCLALHNVAGSPASDSLAAGFYFDDCKKVVCLSCKCIETVNQAGQSVGFFTQTGTANLFQNCISEANAGGSLAAGFHFNGENSSVIIKGKAIANEATSGAGYGIYLEGLLNDKCHISKNSIIGNNGSTISRGIEDERNPSTSNIVRNSAFNNGTNYVVNYPTGITLPTLDGSLTDSLIGLPSLTAGELDNINVNP